MSIIFHNDTKQNKEQNKTKKCITFLNFLTYLCMYDIAKYLRFEQQSWETSHQSVRRNVEYSYSFKTFGFCLLIFFFSPSNNNWRELWVTTAT